MNLVGYTATALSRNDIEDTPTNKNVVDFAIVELKDLQGNLVAMYDDAEGANPETQKTCDTNGQVTFFAEAGDYNLEINGKAQRINLAANIADYIKLGTGESVQEFADSFALKIFQSPTDGELTEIQTRTVNANEVYEVRKASDDSLATIYSDAAGATEIVQNGTDNKSGSDGVVEFFVADGDYYVEVDGSKQGFLVGNIKKEFTTVDDAKSYGSIDKLLGSTVYLKDRKSRFNIIETSTVTPNGIDIIESTANKLYSLSITTPYSLKTSMLGGLLGGDNTKIIQRGLDLSLSGTGIFINDVSCLVSGLEIPDWVEFRNYKTLTHKGSSTDHMLVLGSYSVVNGCKRKGRFNCNKDNQPTELRCVSAEGVNDSGVIDCIIYNVSGSGAFFSSTEDTFCKGNKITDVGNVASEYTTGQYVTNCINHESSRNDIRNTLNSGIKFRADALGNTIGCSTIRDKVRNVTFIGIANGRVQDHLISKPYCVDCGDNGVDVNGSNNVTAEGGTSRRCLDGVYMGENGMTNGKIVNWTMVDCGRAGIGSLGSLTDCDWVNNNINGCGSGVYCSGFVGLTISGGRITGCVKRDYFDNEGQEIITSTGSGIDCQAGLSGCYYANISNVYFRNNAGYDLNITGGDFINSYVKGNIFSDGAGDGRFNYSANSVLTGSVFTKNAGLLTEFTEEYVISASGSTLVTIPVNTTTADYDVYAVVPDWTTEVRNQVDGQGLTSFTLEFTTATPSADRTIKVSVKGLLPATQN